MNSQLYHAHEAKAQRVVACFWVFPIEQVILIEFAVLSSGKHLFEGLYAEIILE